MTVNDTIKTDIVIKSIQSLSMLNFFIAFIRPRGREVTGSSHVCHHCIMSCTNNLYRYFLTDEDSHEQRQSINAVAMTKDAD